MKLLYIITDLDMGGAERALLRLLKQRKQEHNIFLISLVKDGVLLNDFCALGIRVESLGLNYGQMTFYALKHLSKLIKSFNPDIIHSWMYHANLVSYLANCSNAKLVWSIRQCIYKDQKEKLLTKIVLKLCSWISKKIDVIAYNSKLSLTQHQKRKFYGKSDVYIPNGFGKAIIVEEIDKVYDECNIPKDRLLIGLVGRFHAMKDYPMALKSFARLKEVFNFHIIFIGKDLDENNKDLESLVLDIGLKGKVSFLGQKLNLEKYYSAFDFFVSSSLSEAFPNVLAEAMSYGCICVSTDVGDCKEVLSNNGFLCKSESIDDLTDKLKLALSLNKDEKTILSEGAKKRIKENYSIQKITQEYHQLYERLICAE
ncbi:MAG: hypothetical protein COB02_14585 [Candidatus Cloacimonadota bacterium]|nr:MAG: hypothetical protein COB02_14585 [Candidatus Cloacimonadota bacterium]